MKTQMQRRVLVTIGDELLEALDDSLDAFDCILAAYTLARDNFYSKQNDPDPSTIAVGLQAQAMGIKVLCAWLDAISYETSIIFQNRAQEALTRIDRSMLRVGIIIPDTLLL